MPGSGLELEVCQPGIGLQLMDIHNLKSDGTMPNAGVCFLSVSFTQPDASCQQINSYALNRQNLDFGLKFYGFSKFYGSQFLVLHSPRRTRMKWDPISPLKTGAAKPTF